MKNINIKSSTIDQGLKIFSDLIKDFVSPSIKEIGELLGDNIKLYRLKNQLRNLEKIKKICEKEKIIIKKINLKVLFPYLVSVSLEEDENLQEMWSNLFVNYIDSKKNLQVIVYPEILKQISSEEAKLLIKIKELDGQIQFGAKGRGHYDNYYNIEYLANLQRLGLIQEIIDAIVDTGKNTFSKMKEVQQIHSEGYYLTDFGYNFLNSCTR